MSLDAELTACAQLVEKGDPVRFRTVMAAPPEARKLLFPLYAMNVEVSRAPWVTQEAMIAEMRLQWWRDALEEIAEGGPVRRHEVTTPLAAILKPEDARCLDAYVATRRWDIYRDAFEDQAHFEGYLNETSGHLMWTSARLLGAQDETPVRQLAFAAGIAAFLRAVPALVGAGRIPLIDGTHDGLRQLAKRGLEAYAQRPRIIGPALWPAIGTAQTLRQVATDPDAVGDDRLDPGLTSPRLIKASLFKRL